MEASAISSAGWDQARPVSASPPAFTCHLTIQKHYLGTAIQMAHPLHIRSAMRFRDIKITTDNLVIVTRPFPLRQRSRTSTLSLLQIIVQRKLERLGYTQTSKYVWHRVGWRKGNKSLAFYSVFPAQAINSGLKICKQRLGSEPAVNYFFQE